MNLSSVIDYHYYGSLELWVSWSHHFIGYIGLFFSLCLNLYWGNVLHSRINERGERVRKWNLQNASSFITTYILFFSERNENDWQDSVLNIKTNFPFISSVIHDIYITLFILHLLWSRNYVHWKSRNKQNRLSPCLY